MEILSNNTGIAVDDYDEAFVIADGIKVLVLYSISWPSGHKKSFFWQIYLDFPQEEWEHQIFPEPIRSFNVDYYYIVTNTTARRKAISGRKTFSFPSF